MYKNSRLVIELLFVIKSIFVYFHCCLFACKSKDVQTETLELKLSHHLSPPGSPGVGTCMRPQSWSPPAASWGWSRSFPDCCLPSDGTSSTRSPYLLNECSLKPAMKDTWSQTEVKREEHNTAKASEHNFRFHSCVDLFLQKQKGLMLARVEYTPALQRSNILLQSM